MAHDHREKVWEAFDAQMKKHFDQYTGPQYGNAKGNEQIDKFTSADCWSQIDTYIARREFNARGTREMLRDLIKIGHYIAEIYDKKKRELNEGDVYE
jgi:hypothetical protein